MENVKTRFAPSPTGFLHIGGARTALFNYAYAKHFGGKFVLRIEDTDSERSESRFEEDIINSLNWLSIFSDEDIIHQSKRLDVYRSYVEKLLNEGKAYYCFCSKELLETDRTRLIAENKKPMYVERCRELKSPSDEFLSKTPHVVRFKVNRGPGLYTGFKDLIRNQNVSVDNGEIDDFVIVREDGIPTYNFAVVIDDALSGITHVIRGDDHVSNTPKQVMIYNALGFNSPAFAHVSMIMGADGKRLSKRHGATSVNQYREEGFLPEALINYLIRLGWSHGNDEIFSMDEIIKYFDLKNISKSAATFNTEKLLWLNSHYIKSKEPLKLIGLVNEISSGVHNLKSDLPTAALVESMKTRVKTLAELRTKMGFFLSEPENCDAGIVRESGCSAGDIPFLNSLIAFISGLGDDVFKYEDVSASGVAFSDKIKTPIESIKNGFNGFLAENGWTMKEKSMLIRLALTGEKISPPLYEIIYALGKDRCCHRIESFKSCLENL